jgi:hypothetical protein
VQRAQHYRTLRIQDHIDNLRGQFGGGRGTRRGAGEGDGNNDEDRVAAEQAKNRDDCKREFGAHLQSGRCLEVAAADRVETMA